MPPIKVLVTGASGKMAREVLLALCGDADTEPVGAVSRKATGDYLSLPDGSGLIPYSADLAGLLTRTRPQVVVDFTSAEAVLPMVHTAVAHGVAPVIGTTGLSTSELEEIRRLTTEARLGGVVAPNFALGAVLMIHLASIASSYFDYADILEMHHERKADAPSGTALATAQALVQAKGKPFLSPTLQKETLPGTRGGTFQGIAIHSVRLPGLVAHQQVTFGGLGQTLTIRHDSVSRESFMPGVLLAIKTVVKERRFYLGLEELLGL